MLFTSCSSLAQSQQTSYILPDTGTVTRKKGRKDITLIYLRRRRFEGSEVPNDSSEDCFLLRNSIGLYHMLGELKHMKEHILRKVFL